MKFFLDSANINDIKIANNMKIIDGITTNPTLISREKICNKSLFKYYKKLCLSFNGKVNIEVININSVDTILEEALNINKISNNIIIKIPICKQGITAINILNNKYKILTNCTLIFSITQAIIAAKAGANYISPFIGRLDDISYNGIKLIKEISIIFNNYKFDTKIIAASIRNPIHVSLCAKLGIDIVTMPMDIINMLINNPLTKLGIDKFTNDLK